MSFTKYPGRVNKRTAREMFNNGQPIVIVPCKCRAYDGEARLNVMACICDPHFADEDFDNIVEMYEYYNCTPETGTYASFYKLCKNANSEFFSERY